MDKTRATRTFVYILFFLSGISGLVYQIVWTRMLVLVFGNTLLATSTVLSAFMGGLAAGSYLLGRTIDQRPRRLIRLYALLEAGIGLFALLFPSLLDAATPLYAALHQHLGSNIAGLNLIRFSVCFALISIPTFLMGGTLPILLKRFVEESRSIGHQTGFLYGLNTAGAVAGTVACGYFLLRVLGMQQTTWVAVAINLLVAGAAWMIGRKEEAIEPGATSDAPQAAQGHEGEGPAASPATIRMVLLGIGVSGFCALAYEVFWTRMLNLFLHNNIYSFTAILATFLTGIAVGSLLYARFFSRVRDQITLFVALEIGIGLLCYATPLVFQLLHGTLFNRFAEALTLAKTAVVMLPPTILMGMAVPLAVQICQRGARREGTSIGTVYAVNTIGAILGAFVAGFILLPFLGLHPGVILVAALNVLAGFLPLVSRAKPNRRMITSAAFVVTVGLMILVAPSHLFRGLFERSHPSADLLVYKEGKVANVVVYDFKKNGYIDLHLNAVEEASSRLWHVQLFKMLGILPVVLHEEPDDALMIAFGAGMSAGACIEYVSSLDCIDLNPDIDQVAEAFKRENLDVIHNPKLNRVVNDGRNALLLSPRKYSLIISDATNPKMFDSWTLYSQEFYQLVKERLKPDGIFCQWALIPLPGDAIKVILNTFRSVFPHMSFWAIYGSSQVLMLATPERLEIDYQELDRKLKPIFEPSGLAEFGIDSTEKFLSFFLLGEDGVERMLEGFTKVSTDDLPHAQFHIEQDDAGREASLDLVRFQESILPYLRNLGENQDEITGRLVTLDSIERRHHIGFITNNPIRYEEAGEIALDAGIEDENVAERLHYGPEKRRYFRERLLEEPEDLNAANTLGYIYWKRGETGLAIETFRKAIAQEPDFANAYVNLAGVYMDTGAYREAAEVLTDVRKVSPTYSILQKTSSQREDLRLLRRLRREPDSAELWRSLALSYYRQGEIRRAIASYRRAIACEPEDPATLFNLAQVMERHEFVEGALSLYGQLSTLMPNDTRIQTKQEELLRLSRDAEARREWQNAHLVELFGPPAKSEHPKSCDRAYAAWNDADFEGAISKDRLADAAALFEKSIATDGNHLHAYVDAATIYEALGDYSKAANLWRQALQAAPTSQLGAHQARRLELLSELDRTDDDGKRRAALLAEIALHDRLIGELERSIESAEQALLADPSAVSVMESLAETLLEVGRYDDALEMADRALAREPSLQGAGRVKESLEFRPESGGEDPTPN